MAALLFFINVPYNCSDHELHEWIESRGIEVVSIRIVRDLVAGVSPAFAYAALSDETRLKEAISTLSGKKLRDHAITVREASLLTLERDRGPRVGPL
jgi:hypothetical protein